jgi:hypothetical protein
MECQVFLVATRLTIRHKYFYCQETKSMNATELEKEGYLALANKVKATDIEKLSKQKMYLPTSIMDLVWMVQNFHAVISLCF